MRRKPRTPKKSITGTFPVDTGTATIIADKLRDGGYTLEAVTPIDQFLYAAHVEAVAILRR